MIIYHVQGENKSTANTQGLVSYYHEEEEQILLEQYDKIISLKKQILYCI